MTPLVFVLFLITFGLGAATLIIGGIAYLHSSAKILKHYMAIQVIVILDTFNNAICSFLIISMRDPPFAARAYTYVYVYVMTALVIYPVAGLFLGMAGIDYTRGLKRFFSGLAIAIAAACLPALLARSADQAISILDGGLSYFVNPVMLVMVLVMGILMARGIRRNTDTVARRIAKACVAFFCILAPIFALDQVLLNFTSIDIFLPFSSIYDVMYLFWNATGLVILLSLVRKHAHGGSAGLHPAMPLDPGGARARCDG